jgi:hypothetical protein
MQIDPQIVQTILATGILGFSVAALTELLKRLLFPNETTRPKWAGYVCSAIVALASTGVYLFLAHTFALPAFLLYSLFVFLTANGFYKFAASPSQ